MRFQRNIILLVSQMELVVVELDACAELDATEHAEVASAELIGGMDLGSGSDRRMERGRDGRHEFQQGRHAVRAGVALVCGANGIRRASGGA